MHPSPPMPEEIKAGFYPRFESGWRKAELFGRALMLLAITATLGGFLGGGPATLWTGKVESGPLQVEYSPVVRFGTPTGLTVRAKATSAANKVAVTLPANIASSYGMQSVVPQPLESAAGEHDLRMVFPVQPGAREVMIQVAGMPSGAGLMHLSAKLDGGPVVRWSQIVLP